MQWNYSKTEGKYRGCRPAGATTNMCASEGPRDVVPALAKGQPGPTATVGQPSVGCSKRHTEVIDVLKVRQGGECRIEEDG
jgi:hypothetical protein